MGAVDKNGKVWAWSAQKSDKMPTQPSIVESLRVNNIKKVFTGHSYIFAMGENVGEQQS